MNWFNSVDATYRADLRELNETNFVRFDARLEQRIAQLDAKLEQRLVELKAELRVDIAKLESQPEQRLGSLKADLLRWLFGFWISTLFGLGALFFRR